MQSKHKTTKVKAASILLVMVPSPFKLVNAPAASSHVLSIFTQPVFARVRASAEWLTDGDFTHVPPQEESTGSPHASQISYFPM